MTADPERGLVFVPTGSASPDYYGGLRPGDNRWANSVVALDARTGKLAWGFQLVHHDLWDYDTAAAPLLADLPVDGGRKPVVIAGNKTGFVYVLDRDTGKPVWPVEERPVPQSDVPGETTSPTQPFPTTLAGAHAAVAVAGPGLGAQRRRQGRLPGGAGEDGQAQRLLPAGAGARARHPRQCRRDQLERLRAGSRARPADRQRQQPAVRRAGWSPPTRSTRRGKGDLRAEVSPQRGGPYGMSRAPFMSPSGAPCIAPPWGSLVAVDLKTAQDRLVIAAGLDRGAGAGDRQGRAGLGRAGRADRDRRRAGVQRGHDRPAPARLRRGDRQAALAGRASRQRPRHADDLRGGRRQYLVVAAGGSAKIEEERQSDAVVAFALE